MRKNRGFPSCRYSREGSGRERIKIIKEKKELPIILFLPSRVKLII